MYSATLLAVCSPTNLPTNLPTHPQTCAAPALTFDLYAAVTYASLDASPCTKGRMQVDFAPITR